MAANRRPPRRRPMAVVLVFGVAFLIGFRPTAGPTDWLTAAGVLLLFILAISWLAAAFGLLARSPEAAGGFVFLVSFLPYLSSAFEPVETMPTWLHGVADNQPVTRSSRPCAACSSASPSVPAP